MKYFYIQIHKQQCLDNFPKENRPLENFLLDYCPPYNCPGLLLLDNYPKDNCPLTKSPWKLTLTKMAFRMICRLHNQLPLGKMVPRKTAPPQENSPKYKLHPRYFFYTRDIFPPRIRNLTTLIDLIDSCFLLFPVFVVEVSTIL